MRVIAKHPPELSDEKALAMCRPRGTMIFDYHSDVLFEASAGAGILLEVIVERVVFRLWREKDLSLHFLHATPSTGTRVATVDLAQLSASSTVGVALVWAPEETRLHVFDPRTPNAMVTAAGADVGTDVRVGTDSSVYEVGSPGAAVTGARVFRRGQAVLRPTAIQIWTETQTAAQILLGGSSSEGFIFEAVQANAVLVMASTGFEAYSESRFLELESEGLRPDEERLTTKFFSAAERDRALPQSIMEEAATDGVSFAAKLAEKRIDFGNYEASQRAFSAGYGIRFGVDLGVPNTLLKLVKRTIEFRHRIVHVSPLVAFLNQPKSPPEDPIFSNRALAEETLSGFDEFVQALHRVTLALDAPGLDPPAALDDDSLV